jgi:hypothetical protein
MIEKELETAAQEHQDKFYFSEPSPASSFISGVKWAQERLFDEKEMEDYALYFKNAIENTETMPLEPKQWKSSLKHIKKAKTDGFIESLIANTWFREDSENLFCLTADGFIKRGGSKKNLQKDLDGNIIKIK